MAGKHEGTIRSSAPAVANKNAFPAIMPGIKIDMAYAEGRKAGKRGLPITANPHDGAGTEEESVWDNGWGASGFAAAALQAG